MAIIKEVKIESDFITLGQFLKVADIISSGGEAKIFLSENKVFINDELDQRRGRKLYKDDVIRIDSKYYRVCI